MLLLGDRIKKLRKEKGLTQEQLGKLVNVTKVSICGYEKGERIPTLDTLMDLANVLKVEVNYLLGGEYCIGEREASYGVNMARDEIEFIMELRNHRKLYKKSMKDPKRIIELIEKKLG